MREVAAPSRDSLDGMEEPNNEDKTMREESALSKKYQNIGGKQWIQKYMMKRECVKFIPKAKDSTICHCGYEQSQHSKNKEGIKAQTWNEKEHTTTSSTDACGDMHWGFGHRTSKYIRVDHKIPMNLMSVLLTQHWKLCIPKLIISMTGGAKNFTMQPRLKQDFVRGLMKAAQTTGAFIITGGMHAGVMKLVGEAVRLHTIVHRSKKPIVILGIANWGLVNNKECLIKNSETDNGPMSYKEDTSCEITIPIDSNHSHFILVDNGKQHQQNFIEVDFRAELEGKLSDGNEKEKPTIVCVVLEGGATSLRTVRKALEKHTPTVIIKGSGRAADVLAFAYDETKSKTFHTIKEEVRKMISEWETDRNYIASMVSDVEECLKNRDHMKVFQLDSSNPAKDLDLAILQAVLKQNNKSMVDQLELALAWNRIDVANSEIFTDDARKKIQTEDLKRLMHLAIMNDCVDFVALFVENGVLLNEYLTKERLLRLYNNDLVDVENLIRELTGVFYKLNDSTEKMIDPVCELFLWSVLMLRLDMAKYFLEEGKEGIASALTAQVILECLRSRTNDSEMIKKIDKQIKYYENLAVDVLSVCYLEDEKRSQQILVRKLPQFGRATAVELAVKADSKKFIAHAACQSKLNNIWMGQMTNNNGWKLWLCMLLPFLIFPLVKFRTEQTTADTQARFPWYRKIAAFYQAPVIKFFFYVMSDLAFLTIYSYVMLVMFTVDRMYPSNRIYFDPWEIVLIVWFGSLLIEEIRQMTDIGTYFGDKRNFLDSAAMVMFLVGFTLRCIPPNTCSPCFTTARIFHALSLMTFIITIVNMFTAHKKLGPKLVMIKQMMIDMSSFVIILMVFVVAYGITTQAIMFPGSALSIELLRDILHRPYFQIFGELFMETIQGDSCPDDPCPEETSRWLVPILLGLYILITHVLMINLLIAMFSYTFTMIHDRSDQHWHFQRYSLIKEYYDRPPLIPPFIVLCHLVLIVRFFLQKCFKMCLHVPNVFSTELNEEETKEIIEWENLHTNEFLLQDKINKRRKYINESMDSVAQKVNEIHKVIENQQQNSEYSGHKELRKNILDLDFEFDETYHRSSRWPFEEAEC